VRTFHYTECLRGQTRKLHEFSSFSSYILLQPSTLSLSSQFSSRLILLDKSTFRRILTREIVQLNPNMELTKTKRRRLCGVMGVVKELVVVMVLALTVLGVTAAKDNNNKYTKVDVGTTIGIDLGTTYSW